MQTEEITEKTQTEVNKAAEFVAAIIESCLTPWHLVCAQKLFELFKEKFSEKRGGKMATEMLMEKIVAKIPMIQETY